MRQCLKLVTLIPLTSPLVNLVCLIHSLHEKEVVFHTELFLAGVLFPEQQIDIWYEEMSF